MGIGHLLFSVKRVGNCGKSFSFIPVLPEYSNASFFFFVFGGQLVEGQIVKMSRNMLQNAQHILGAREDMPVQSAHSPLFFRKIVRNERLPYGRPSWFLMQRGGGRRCLQHPPRPKQIWHSIHLRWLPANSSPGLFPPVFLGKSTGDEVGLPVTQIARSRRSAFSKESSTGLNYRIPGHLSLIRQLKSSYFYLVQLVCSLVVY